MIEKIQMLRAERGWTYEVLEAAARLPRKRFGKWVGGIGEPTARQAFQLARALGVPVEFLVDDEMEELPDPLLKLSDGERIVLKFARQLGIDRAAIVLHDALAHGEGEDVGLIVDSPPSPRRQIRGGPA